MRRIVEEEVTNETAWFIGVLKTTIKRKMNKTSTLRRRVTVVTQKEECPEYSFSLQSVSQGLGTLSIQLPLHLPKK